MSASLVGSEMCIRDRLTHASHAFPPNQLPAISGEWHSGIVWCSLGSLATCLLYTSPSPRD
eukprot:14050640-Alexandrium_andersonii.AAC.1